MKALKLIPLTLIAALIGCSPENPADDLPPNDLFQNSVTGKAAPLTKAEFNALTPEQQYRVANKLLGTMFRGVSVHEFFDLSKGIDNLSVKDPNFLNTIAVKLINRIPTVDDIAPGELSIDDYKDKIGRLGSINSIFNISELAEGAPQQVALAHTTQLPLSSDSFNNWIAYILANTILFSPAEEIDSTSALDTQAVYNRLVDQLAEETDIGTMILSHEKSPQNWRRFRSPEDNTREMIEIYLGLFVPEPDMPGEQNDVVNASIACQHLYLSDGEDGLPIYQLVSNGNYNTEQVTVLDTAIVTCDEFYALVAARPEAVPRMVSTIVETLMLNRSGADRAAMIQSITAAGPTTFQDIFSAIIFSKEYLLYTERAKSFEENYYNIANRLNYKIDNDHFIDTASCNNNNGCSTVQTYLGNMNWPSMTNKLGRLAGVPLDTLSFAHYHRGFREDMVIDNNADTTPSGYRTGLIDSPDTVQPDLEDVNSSVTVNTIISDMTDAEFLDYLFLSMLERKAEADEIAALTPLMGSKSQTARIVLDYISRLPEQYYFNCTKGLEMTTDPITSEVTLGECVQ